MSVDKLVDSAKLDACLDAEADAIRAKTGGSTGIPFDFANNKGFADAIAAIPSGGGGMEWELIGESEAAEDVSVLQVNIPASKQNRAIYKIVIIAQVAGTGSGYHGCPLINSITPSSPYDKNVYSKDETLYAVRNTVDNAGYGIVVKQSAVCWANGTAEFFAYTPYRTENHLVAGSKITVYALQED